MRSRAVRACAGLRPRADRRRSPRGSASVYAVLVVGLLATVAATAGLVVGAVVAHRRAEAAADLAALAGARAALRGDDACAAAAALARRNGSRLSACRAAGAVVDVDVSVTAPAPLASILPRGAVTGAARAGPAGATRP